MHTDAMRVLPPSDTDGGEEALGELGGHHSGPIGALPDVDEDAVPRRRHCQAGRDVDD